MANEFTILPEGRKTIKEELLSWMFKGETPNVDQGILEEAFRRAGITMEALEDMSSEGKAVVIANVRNELASMFSGATLKQALRSSYVARNMMAENDHADGETLRDPVKAVYSASSSDDSGQEENMV